jgi:CheY-like chemotaxis protein
MMKTSIKSILIVDDSENDVTLIKESLKEARLLNEIAVAEDGEEALDFLYKRGKFINSTEELPVFILLDIKMPLLNGIEVLKIIRSDTTFKKVPIIMLTSSRDARDLHSCYEYGANSFVVKPVNMVDFMKVVHEIGQYWAVINEYPS